MYETSEDESDVDDIEDEDDDDNDSLHWSSPNATDYELDSSGEVSGPPHTHSLHFKCTFYCVMNNLF